MQFLDHLRPRLILYSRILMWAVIGLFVVAGIFQNVPAWAETAVCTGNDTTGNSSIPVNPLTLFLRYDGPASTYDVSLCGNPPNGEDVDFTTSVTPSGRVTVNPSTFTLNNTDPETISVAVAIGRPRAVPFTATIVNKSTSEIEGFNRTITVTAYYSPPAALRDVAIVRRGQSVPISVLANDTDRLGQANLTSAIVTAPARGTATVNANQTIQYTASNGRPGADPFTYRVIDNIGNFDTARVLVVVVPTNVNNPQTLEVDPDEGGTLVTDDGKIQIEVPVLPGVSPNSEVVCVAGPVATLSGPLSSRPVQPSRYTGVSFYIQCSVDGEPLAESTLTSPIVVTIPLTDEFLAQFGETSLSVANWNEEDWRSIGIEIVSGPNNGSLTVNTRLLGEFSIFSQSNKFFPKVSNNE